MPDTLSPYKPTAVDSVGPAQNGSVFLPQYSHTNPRYWWEEALQEVCQTADPGAINNALRLLPAPSNAVALLSNRGEGWLNTCLEVICKRHNVKVPPYNSPESAARTVVDIITWRRSPPLFNGDWIVPALQGKTAIPIISEQLDFDMLREFSRTTISGWLAWRLGYANEITDFLDTMITARDRLICYAQSHGTAKLESLLQALPSQQPLLQWMLSSAISCDNSSLPTTRLRFLIDPIERELTIQQSDFRLLIQHLLILETRFQLKIVNSSDVTWSAPFPIDFSLWSSINMLSACVLAKSITKAVKGLFRRVSPANITGNDRHVKDVGRNWSAFSDDVLACLNADAGVVVYVKDLVDALLSSSPRNIHSATAIGSALKRWGFQAREPWASWDIINPDGNFAGCVELMLLGNCIPYMNRITMEAHKVHGLLAMKAELLAMKAENDQILYYFLPILTRILEEENIKSVHLEKGKRQKTSQGIMEVEEKSVHSEEQQTSWGVSAFRDDWAAKHKLGDVEGKDTVQKRTYNGKIPNYAECLPSSSSAVGKHPVHDSSQLGQKYLIDNKQPNTKRAAVAVRFNRPYFNRSQQHQDSMFHDPIPSSGNDTNYFALNHGRGFGIDETQRDLHDTDTQPVNFAKLSEGPYSMTVARVSTPLSASNPALGHVEGSRYLKNASTLQGDSTVRFESSEKINQNPVQHENPAELLATPKPNPEKKFAVGMSGKHTGNADEDSFGTHSDSSFPSTTGTSVSPDLANAVPKQSRKLFNDAICIYPDAVARTTKDVLDRPGTLGPEPLSLTAPKNTLKQEVAHPEGFALTDEQCERIQKIVDPDDIRQFKLWEHKLQPKLIRLYMTGMTFPQIASQMKSRLSWSYKTYTNRFRDWCFPVDRIERPRKIIELHALLSGSTQLVGSQPRDMPPKPDFLAFNERLNSQLHSSARLHVAGSKPGRKMCTRSCTGCVTCKREGERCDGLQLSGKKGMVEESSILPLSISANAEQINPKDAFFEYHSPATFYPSPSTKQSLLEYKRADGNLAGFWLLERDDGVDDICRLVQPSERP